MSCTVSEFVLWNKVPSNSKCVGSSTVSANGELSSQWLRVALGRSNPLMDWRLSLHGMN